MRFRTIIVAVTLLTATGVLGTLVAQDSRPAGRTETFAVDNVHSTVIFRIRHLGVSYSYGRFNEISGSVTFNDADDSKNAFEISIKMDSVDTNSAGRDRDLKSEHFFDIENHANMTFKSTKVSKTGDKTYHAEGELTIHGLSKQITVELERPGTRNVPRFGYRTGFETTFTINRRDFGLTTYPSEMLGDDIKITVSIEATGEAPEDQP